MDAGGDWPAGGQSGILSPLANGREPRRMRTVTYDTSQACEDARFTAISASISLAFAPLPYPQSAPESPPRNPYKRRPPRTSSDSNLRPLTLLMTVAPDSYTDESRPLLDQRPPSYHSASDVDSEATLDGDESSSPPLINAKSKSEIVWILAGLWSAVFLGALDGTYLPHRTLHSPPLFRIQEPLSQHS